MLAWIRKAHGSCPAHLGDLSRSLGYQSQFQIQNFPCFPAARAVYAMTSQGIWASSRSSKSDIAAAKQPHVHTELGQQRLNGLGQALPTTWVRCKVKFFGLFELWVWEWWGGGRGPALSLRLVPHLPAMLGTGHHSYLCVSFSICDPDGLGPSVARTLHSFFSLCSL